MSVIDQNTEYEAIAEGRFLDQFKNSVDLKALSKAFAEQIQDLESAAFEVILERSLDDAVGVQLTTLGKIVGEPRTTSDDELFRQRIRARLRINRSSGTAEDLIAIVTLLTLAFAETFELRDEPPAQLRITVIDPMQSMTAAELHRLLELADAAGVRLLLQFNSSLDTQIKKFGLDNTPLSLPGLGSLGSTTGAVANPGQLSSVIE
jgi:hypothetical protein